MRHTITLILPCLLASCTVGPFIKGPGGQVASLGGSIFTKTAGESSSYSGPLGNLTHTSASKDETVVPGKLINYYGLKAAINGLTDITKTTEATKTTLSTDSVSKNATNQAAEVEKLKILNPVEEIPQ